MVANWFTDACGTTFFMMILGFWGLGRLIKRNPEGAKKTASWAWELLRKR